MSARAKALQLLKSFFICNSQIDQSHPFSEETSVSNGRGLKHAGSCKTPSLQRDQFVSNARCFDNCGSNNAAGFVLTEKSRGQKLQEAFRDASDGILRRQRVFQVDLRHRRFMCRKKYAVRSEKSSVRHNCDSFNKRTLPRLAFVRSRRCHLRLITSNPSRIHVKMILIKPLVENCAMCAHHW